MKLSTLLKHHIRQQNISCDKQLPIDKVTRGVKAKLLTELELLTRRSTFKEAHRHWIDYSFRHFNFLTLNRHFLPAAKHSRSISRAFHHHQDLP